MKTASSLYCLDSQWEKAGEIAYKILKVSEATNDSIGIAKFHLQQIKKPTGFTFLY